MNTKICNIPDWIPRNIRDSIINQVIYGKVWKYHIFPLTTNNFHINKFLLMRKTFHISKRLLMWKLRAWLYIMLRITENTLYFLCRKSIEVYVQYILQNVTTQQRMWHQSFLLRSLLVWVQRTANCWLPPLKSFTINEYFIFYFKAYSFKPF